MRWVTSESLTANVHGTRRTVAIVPGTRVDLDEPIGDCDGHPVTLAQALGSYAALLREDAPEPSVPRTRKAAPAPVDE